jgi:formate dehydrogenase major subunit
MSYTELVQFTIDGREVSAELGETIIQTADRNGIDIPRLCYKPGYRPDGNCRACMVEIDGERVLAPSCCRYPQQGMKVLVNAERPRNAQKMVLELLKSDVSTDYAGPSELDSWCERLDVGGVRFEARSRVTDDHSNPAIAVDLNRCIQCTRCVRACREEQVNGVIGFAGRGDSARIVFDIEDPMGQSTCVSCGECVQACPTGALLPANVEVRPELEQKVESTCPYCGVGCLLTYHVRDGRIIRAEGRDGPSNHERLCVKGRYGFDYINHPGRLTRPLIRRPGVAKTADLIAPENMLEVFREASWEEALEFAVSGLKSIRDQHGGKGLAGFGSAKGSNEEAYLFQKLVRTGFGTNNVDHCTRLCHASSVAALLEGLGSGAVSNQVADVSKAEVIVVIGSKPTVNHPVAATFMKNATLAGKKLVVMDPYRSELNRHATHFLQFRPGTDVPMLNALMHTIIEEGLQDDEFIRTRTEGYDALKEQVAEYSPETVSSFCGIPAEELREVARLYATSKGSMIFWGMGISQHTHGTDNVRCLIALALLTGQIGRDGTGLHPLRGQNNVQGASDVGLIPMSFPGYQRVDNQEARLSFEKLWDTQLDDKPGLTVVEIMHAIQDGVIRGMYIEGENPAMSDPNLNHARAALANLEHLVVQDIFFTETAGFADVILPASAFPEKTGTFTNTDRRVQLGRQAVDSPGEAKQDLWIIQEIARGLGLPWNYNGPEDVFDEIRKAIPDMAGITWQRLEAEHSLTYPLLKENDPGTPTIFTERFPTANGLGKFVPAQYNPADELPDKAYPLIFTTGRQLEHWHTGSMTRRASVLNQLEPEPVVCVNPADIVSYGLEVGGMVSLESRRGSLSARLRSDAGIQPGSVFMAFCYHEAAANLLTNEALDPFGKIPEFKFCAVRIRSQHAEESAA